MKFWWLLFILNLPLLQEVTRKYLVHSDLVFFGADLLVLGTAVMIGLQGKLNLEAVPFLFWMLSALFVVLTALTHVLNGNHIGLYGIGLHATFLPLVYLLISARYVSAGETNSERLLLCVTSWILIIGTVALLQIVLGKNHPINSVWGTSAMGIGDFATREKAVLIPGMFRPASIFTHTGKFGQVIFTLVLFRWCHLLFSQGKRSTLSYALMLFDLVVIFVSGQRAALMFLVLAMLIVALVYMRQHGAKVRNLLLPVAIIPAGLLGAWIARPTLATAVYERFASVINAVPTRLEGNLWLPIKTMLDSYLFTGEGLGYFTFGSRIFGGVQVFDAIKMQGLGESSLIRLSGEVGLTTATMIVVACLAIVTRGFRVCGMYVGSSIGSGAVYFSVWMLCLMLWSNTADVFANSIVTTIGSALGGACLGRAGVRGFLPEPGTKVLNQVQTSGIMMGKYKHLGRANF